MAHIYANNVSRWRNCGSGSTSVVKVTTRVFCMLVLSSNVLSGAPSSSRIDIIRGKIHIPKTFSPDVRASQNLPEAKVLNFNPSTSANITVNGQTIFLTPSQQQLFITLLTNVLLNDTSPPNITSPNNNLSLSPLLADMFAGSNYGLRIGDFLGTAGLASQAAQAFINPFSAANSNLMTSVFGLGNPSAVGPFGLGNPGAHLFRPFRDGSNSQLVNNDALALLLQSQPSSSSLGFPNSFQAAGSSSTLSAASLQAMLNPNSLESIDSLIPGSQLAGINTEPSGNVLLNGFARIAQPSSNTGVNDNNGGFVLFH